MGKGFERTKADAEHPTYTTERVTYPSRRPDRPANAKMGATLRIPVKTPRGLIVVLPILGGDYGPSDTFARHLSESGFTTLRFDRKADLFDPEKDFAHVASVIVEGSADIRRGLSWALTQRLQGRGRVGLIGISMGSFVGTIVAATDPRIDATVLALGGAGLPTILRHARSEPEIGALFDALEARGWSDEKIHDAMAQDLAVVEPLAFAPHLNPNTTLLIHARFDAVVPFENGQRFRTAAHEPERIVTLTGHYSAALLLPYLLDAVEAHFAKWVDP